MINVQKVHVIQKVMCLSMSSGRSKCGANVREQTPGYGHKRMHACYNGHLNIVQFLFQNNGAEDDVRRQNNEGITPML